MRKSVLAVLAFQPLHFAFALIENFFMQAQLSERHCRSIIVWNIEHDKKMHLSDNFPLMTSHEKNSTKHFQDKIRAKLPEVAERKQTIVA